MKDLGRIRWRCRRGLLELDLVLAAFARAELERLPEPELACFTELLERADNELWDWVSGRSEPDEPRLEEMVRRLRSVRAMA